MSQVFKHFPQFNPDFLESVAPDLSGNDYTSDDSTVTINGFVTSVTVAVSTQI